MNGFLGVDYIGLDTSHNKIDGLIVRGRGAVAKKRSPSSKASLSAGQHDFWSNDGSIFNFDYIRLDTSHSKIILIQGVHNSPKGRGSGGKKNWNLKDYHKRGVHVKNRVPSSKNTKMWPCVPTLFFSL